MVANGLGVTFVSAPEVIINAYLQLTDLLSYYLIELWFDVTIPQLLTDLIVLWLMFSFSNVRLLFLKGKDPIYLFRGFFGNDSYKNPWTKILKYELRRVLGHWLIIAPLLFCLGPLGTLGMMRGMWLTKAEHKALWKTVRYSKSQDDAVYLYETVTFLGTAVRMFIVIILANPVVAIGLLWWNAAEISRLASV
ncbi:hypothetical protein [Aquisalinus flavus]|nr:hypothetical protein [Aquisalinus flavus]MBD0426859.1 hypothetical protein [Aquisalinus flavus]UNE46705.1 hypothetical protein FF099_00840 [Aquisalinus flavus]